MSRYLDSEVITNIKIYHILSFNSSFEYKLKL